MNCYLLGTPNWTQWRNDGAETVGPFQVFKIIDNEVVGDENVAIGELPDGEGSVFAVNGLVAVEAGRWGGYQTSTEFLVAYDGDAPAVGDLYGPKAGQGTAAKDGAPAIFQCLGPGHETHKIMRARLLPSGTIRFAWATTVAAVNQNDETFEVTDVVPCDGSSFDEYDDDSESGSTQVLTVQNTPLRYGIDGGTTGLIKRLAKPDGSGEYAWYPDDFACCDGCACECQGDSSV